MVELYHFYKNFIEPDQLCFDVGANIGERTDVFLQLGAKVICIEPQPDCVEILHAKYDQNLNVEILPVGLASIPGVMTLSICSTANTISTFSEKWKTGRFEEYSWDSRHDVEMLTLDELIGRYGTPKFCKIDVEGFELEVIKGLSSPIDFISFEFTSEFFGDAKKCIQYLQSIGNVEFNFVQGDSLNPRQQFGLDTWVDGRSLGEHLNRLSVDLFWGDVYAHFV